MLVLLIQLPVFGLVGFILWKILSRRNRRAENAQPVDEGDGWTSIPIAAAFGGVRGLPWWLGTAHNNANPSLSIGRAGIRYRIIRLQERPFSDIALVDVRGSARRSKLCFQFRSTSATFLADILSSGLAAKALSLIPPEVPLSERAKQFAAENVVV